MKFEQENIIQEILNFIWKISITIYTVLMFFYFTTAKIGQFFQYVGATVDYDHKFEIGMIIISIGLIILSIILLIHYLLDKNSNKKISILLNRVFKLLISITLLTIIIIKISLD